MPPLLSLTGKQWTTLQEMDAPPSAIIARLMAERGLTGGALPSPDLFPDMPRAVERIRRAVRARERVGIFGDYDCDGITAAALLVRWFRRQGIDPHVILPHRVRDGYGLKRHIIDTFAAQKVSLLLTVDTGITAVAEIAEAGQQGITVIVTDHHHLQAEVPSAHAILHPALAPAYAPPHPSGSGVAYQLLRALEGRGDWPDRDTDLALAAIGMVADLVPLTGSNRAIVSEGLAALNRLTAGPLHELREHVRTPGRPLTSADVAFRLAPRLNAAGRMEDPKIALRAILEGGEALAVIDRLNAHRQDQMNELFEEVWEMLGLPSEPSVQSLTALPSLLSLSGEQFPEGLIGLIAGKLTDATGHPSMVVAMRSGECTASLRSTRAYHITEGLERVSDLLSTFGGHAQAAGCTFPRRHLAALTERLNADIAARTTPASLLPLLELHGVLRPQHITLLFCERLKDLEPFGQGNPEPLFLLPSVHLEAVRRVGQEDRHLQARIGSLKAIGWRLGHLAHHTSQPLDLACRLSVDTWNGRKAPQIVIEDLRVVSPSTASHIEEKRLKEGVLLP